MTTYKPRKFSCVNIREFIAQSETHEQKLSELLSYFSCPKNSDVENFLKYNAIDFTKKNQSVTYLIFPVDEALPAGYFTIAVKTLTISLDDIASKTQQKKIERVCKLDKNNRSYTMPAYLIAQLGKNFNSGMNDKISGSELLSAALEIIKRLQYLAGGMVAFVEAENNISLLNFYEQNGFKTIEPNLSQRFSEQGHELIQLFRLI